MLKKNTVLVSFLLLFCRGAQSAEVVVGDLKVEVITAYNLVVDSNVLSPSTYAPRSAYFGAHFTNLGANTMTDVYANIGDHAAGTPGIYPVDRHQYYPQIAGPLDGPSGDGYFTFTHEGGTLGLADATRYLGELAPGETKTVYWLISYPNVDAAGDDPVWGPSVKPEDDLVLEYDVWATVDDGGTPVEASLTRTATMRNEISAMANKILPNGANKVPQFYKDLLQQYVPTWTREDDDGTPGTRVIGRGVWYDLGNVGHGFDNDGDLVPDRNAWMQPVGDPSLFDSGAFRLVKTYALVIVKLNDGTIKEYYGEDQLYFENIPPNNRGAIGWVGYEFMPLLGPGTVALSPYQEVASGYDNEKFNGDYGVPGSTLSSQAPTVTLEKGVDQAVAAPSDPLVYTLSYTNPGSVGLGDLAVGMPVTLRDSIPEGTVYAGGSAAANNTLPAGVGDYTIRYSTDNGATWTTDESSIDTATVTDIQWWLSDIMAAGTSGTVTFEVTIDSPFTQPLPIVDNVGELGFGDGPPALEDDARTILTGPNSLGDTVFADDGDGSFYANAVQELGEPGIHNITVTLYYDVNGDGILDDSDVLYDTATTDISGNYLFASLPDGNYLAVVDIDDPELPNGYTLTTDQVYAADLDAAGTNASPVSDLNADFGFAPALTLDKELVGSSPVYEDDLITYTIDVSNELPGDGTGSAVSAVYTAWGDTDISTLDTGTDTWPDSTNALDLDGIYATAPLEDNSEELAISNIGIGTNPGTITRVEVVLPIQLGAPDTYDKNDTFEIHIHDLTGGGNVEFYTSAVFTIRDLAPYDDVFTIDITGTPPDGTAWTWDDFGTNIAIQMLVKKGGNATGVLLLDAMALRVTSDEAIGGGSDATTLQPVPLVDTYDADLLEFVSAEPVPAGAPVISGSSPDTIGALQWSDIGPIYPGGTERVTVTFRVLEPPGNTAITNIRNTASVTEATFKNGVDANDDEDFVDITVEPTGSIGDFVWLDLNADGVQDGGDEAGIAGVTVQLSLPGVDLGNGIGNPISTVTDQNGGYLFDGLTATGNYLVTVDTTSLPGNPADYTNTWDEDDLLVNPDSSTVVPLGTSGGGPADHLSADFGYDTSVSIIDGLVWHDINRSGLSGDGTRDTGEPWFASVTVTLYDSTDTPVASIDTDANGYFQFSGNYSGDYYVVVDTADLPAGTIWNQSYDNDDADGTFDTPDRVDFSIVQGGTAHADYSYYGTGLYDIGDTVYFDWNGNGSQDANEEGIWNVTVSLYADTNANGIYDVGTDLPVAADETDTAGNYLFENMPAGSYVIVVDENDADFPTGYSQTQDPDDAGIGIAGDSAGGVTFAGVADDLDEDFGYYPTRRADIGDTVFYDADGDGVQSGPIETGIENISVTLFVDLNGDGVFVEIASTTTDADGNYLFPDLPDGDYQVVVNETDPDLPVDSFGNIYTPTTATTYDVTLAGIDFLDADFGFNPLSAIGDTVWWDANGNADKDWNEDGIPGVIVELYRDADGDGIYSTGDVPVATAVTDSNGNYLFDGLEPDDYVVKVDETSAILSGAILTSDPDNDGIPIGQPGATSTDAETGHTLSVGESYMGADFGYQPPGVIGDTVWIDLNQDGIKGSGELGIPYVTVELWSGGVKIDETETDGDGIYLFDNLPDGTYEVRVLTSDPDFPSSLSQVYDPDGTADNRGTNIVISSGSIDLSQDFGYSYAGDNELSGTVGFDDASEDGLLNGLIPNGTDTDESPFPNQDVYLYMFNDANDNGVVDVGETATLIATTRTAANGDYSFSNLPDGDAGDKYAVSLTAPDDHLILTTDSGETGAGRVVTANNNLAGENISAYQVVPVQLVTENVDFAYKSSVNYDYGDLPNSYSTQFGDSPGGPRHIIPSTPNLYLGVAAPDAENNGQPSVDADGDGADEDGVVPSSVWWNFLDGGEITVDVGAGTGWLMGWIDFDGSGDFTGADELVVSQAVNSTTGTYVIPFDIPVGAINEDGTTTLYSRFRLFPSEPGIPEIAWFTEAGNGEVEDYQWTLGAFGDYVWNDSNRDGVQDAGELPIEGVIVYVDLDNDGVRDPGEPNGETDANGQYWIGGIAEDGTYSVRVDTTSVPTGLTPTWDLDGLVETSGGTPHVATVALTGGATRDDVDFGYALGAEVVGHVYYDSNGDGDQDPGEPDMKNVELTITDTYGNTRTVFTDSSGDWSVIVPPGNTTADVDETSAGFLSYFPDGFVYNDTNNHTEGDDPTTVAAIAGSTVGLTGTPNNIDGYYLDDTIVGDFVWNDINRNGIQDAGEPGIPGVTVWIENTDANETGGVERTISDDFTTFSGGGSNWDDANWTQTGDVATGPGTVILGGDTNNSPGPGRISRGFTLPANLSGTTGDTVTVTVEVSAFNDRNNVGDSDFFIQYSTNGTTWTVLGAEITAAGTYVFSSDDYPDLFNATDIRIGANAIGEDLDAMTISSVEVEAVDYIQRTTSSEGRYYFFGTDTLNPLQPYYIRVDPNDANLTGMTLTAANQGAGDELDSDASLNNGADTIAMTYPTGTDMTHDFGYYADTPNVDLGDLPDSTSGVTTTYKTLLADNGPSHIIVSGLQLGASIDAELDGQPNATATGDGADDDGVSFPIFTSGNSAQVQVDATNTTGSDAILYGFIDWNNDGDFLDAGETGSITVPTGTDGTVNMPFNVPAGAVTGTDIGARFRLSTDTGLTAVGHATDGEVEDYLVQVSQPTQLGNYVWIDTDNDGIQDAGESGLAGVSVGLYNSTGTLLRTTVTAADGSYLFSDLAPGDYYVDVTLPSGYLFATQQAGGDDTLDSDVDSAGTSRTVTLAAGTSFLDLDAGLVRTAALSGAVYNDVDRDDGFSGADTPLETIRIQLWTDPNGNGDPTDDGTLYAITDTDTSGGYSFTDLPPGNYVVVEVDASGYYSVADITNPNDNRVPVILAAGDDSTGNDFLDRNDPVTAAFVRSVTAWMEETGGVVQVATDSEVGSLAYELFRQETDGSLTAVSLAPVAAANAPAGASYRIKDPFAFTGETVNYLIHEYEIRGTVRIHGPFQTVVLPVAPPFPAPGIQSVTRTDNSPFRASATSNLRGTPVADALQLSVTEEGVYGVGIDQLAEAFGTSLEDAAAALVGGNYALANQGQPIPWWPSVNGDRLLFFGTTIKTAYTKINVYNLQPGEGLVADVRALDEPAAMGRQTYIQSQQFEMDLTPSLDVRSNPDTDVWSWKRLTAGHSFFDNANFSIKTYGRTAEGEAAMHVQLYGAMDTEAEMEHKAIITLNGEWLGEVVWGGLSAQVFSATFPASLLNDGRNTLNIKADVLPETKAGSILVESFDLTWPTTAEAYQNFLPAYLAGNDTYSLRGFTTSDIELLDITDPEKPVVLVGGTVTQAGSKYDLAFANSAHAARVAAYTANGVETPALKAVQDSHLKDAGHMAGYLIVCPESLLPAARILADYRQTTETSVKIVTFEDICAEFADGLWDPNAIHRLLAYAGANWQQAPDYVVLVGDGTYDYYNYYNYSDNLLPPVLAATEFGLFCSDAPLADVDGLPDLAIGRLPVQTVAQMEHIVQKIRSFEASRDATWDLTGLFVAGVSSRPGEHFADNLAEIAALLPPNCRQLSYELTPDTVAATREAMKYNLNRGTRILNYSGHGSLTRLSQHGLFGPEHIADLDNADHPAIMIASSCLVGRFGVPGTNALGEQLLLADNGGIVACIAAVSLRYDSQNQLFNTRFIEVLGDKTVATLGAAFVETQIRNADVPGSVENSNSLVLLGDPALRTGFYTIHTPAPRKPKGISPPLVLPDIQIPFIGPLQNLYEIIHQLVPPVLRENGPAFRHAFPVPGGWVATPSKTNENPR